MTLFNAPRQHMFIFLKRHWTNNSDVLFDSRWPMLIRASMYNLMGCLAILLGIFLAFQKLSMNSTSSWNVKLNLETEESAYSSDSTLLTVHVLPDNEMDKGVSFDSTHSAFRLAVREVPAGLLEHFMLDVGRGKLIADKNFMPTAGWTLLPHTKLMSTFSIVLHKGARVAIGAELTRNDEFVKTGKFVHIAP